MQPKVNYPAGQINARGISAALNSSNSVVMAAPITSAGYKAAYWRMQLSAGAAYVRIGASASSVTATTGDTIITSNEALYINSLGANAVAGLQIGSTNAILQVSPLEEGGMV